MNEELTNEAAEMIGQYTYGGKKIVLADLIKQGGVIKKELIDCGKIEYYLADGETWAYIPAHASIAIKYRRAISKNTGYSEEQISELMYYLYSDKHNLVDKDPIRRNRIISDMFERLKQGEGTEPDMELLKQAKIMLV